MNKFISDAEVQIHRRSNDAEIQEWDNFINSGYFTKRRTEKFWSGSFTDIMVIEQELMRAIKVEGGIIGRGVEESTMQKWIVTLPYTFDIYEEVERFCGIRFTNSEQHIDATDSWINKDREDLKK